MHLKKNIKVFSGKARIHFNCIFSTKKFNYVLSFGCTQQFAAHCAQCLSRTIQVLNFTSEKPESNISLSFSLFPILEGTARYAGFTSRSCGGLWPPAEAFFALWAKKELFMLFWLTLGHFWCSVVTSVTFSNNLSNYEKKKKK